MSEDLTPKQTAFVKHLPLCNFNGTAAAKKAGCPAKNARITASKWLTKSNIQRAIAKSQRKVTEKLDIKAERIIREIEHMAYSNIKNYVDFGPVGVTLKELSKISDDHAAAIQSVEHKLGAEGAGSVKFKLYDKNTSLEKLMKHTNLYPVQTLDINMKRDIKELDDDELNALIERLEARSDRAG